MDTSILKESPFIPNSLIKAEHVYIVSIRNLVIGFLVSASSASMLDDTVAPNRVVRGSLLSSPAGPRAFHVHISTYMNARWLTWWKPVSSGRLAIRSGLLLPHLLLFPVAYLEYLSGVHHEWARGKLLWLPHILPCPPKVPWWPLLHSLLASEHSNIGPRLRSRPPQQWRPKYRGPDQSVERYF